MEFHFFLYYQVIYIHNILKKNQNGVTIEHSKAQPRFLTVYGQILPNSDIFYNSLQATNI